MKCKYKNEINLLLKLGNPFLKNINFVKCDTEDINWDYIIAQSDYHQISPYIYVNLKKSKPSIDSNIKSKLKLKYIYSLWKYANLEKEFKKIANILTNKKIEFVPLKGFALIENLYHEPIIRYVTDIDILVKPKELLKVDNVLKKNHYKKIYSNFSEEYYKKYHCHYMYMKDSKLIEIHWGLSFDKPNKIKIPKLWERIEDLKIGNLKLKNLSKEDTLIALALHQRRFDKPLYLKTLLDISILIEKYYNLIDWNYIYKIAIKNKLKHLFYLIFSIAKNLYKTPIPKEILKKFYPGYLKKKFIEKKIKEYIFHPKNNTLVFRKRFYLMLNFIWYDTLWDILSYILWLPEEKFASFYDLVPYTYKSSYLFKIRFIYIPIIFLKNSFKKYLSKIVS